MQERNLILKLTHGRNLRLKLEMLKYCWWHLDVWRDVTSCAAAKKHFPAPPKLLLLLCSYLHLSSANRACTENGGMENMWNMLIINHSNPKIRGWWYICNSNRFYGTNVLISETHARLFDFKADFNFVCFLLPKNKICSCDMMMNIFFPIVD